MISLTCPYCNAQVSIDTADSSVQRVVCPRCGESFARSSVAMTPKRDSSTDHADLPHALMPAGVSNGMLALLVLGAMSIIAALALAFMLRTQEIRREHDTNRPPKYEIIHIRLAGRLLLSAYLIGLAYFLARDALPVGSAIGQVTRARGWRIGFAAVLVVLALVVPFILQTRPAPGEREIIPVRQVPPGELEGLGYLPADVDAIGAVHVAEAMQTQAGRDIVGKLRLGQSDLAVDTFADWLGVLPDEIDHIVLGIKAPTQIYVVVRTRRSYDRERVTSFKKLEVREHPQATESLPLYQCELKVMGRLTLKPIFWCADNRTLLLFQNVDVDAIARVPVPAPSGSDHLEPPLRTLLHDDNGPCSGAHLWVAARSAGLNSPFVSMIRPVDDDGIVSKIDTLAIWVKPAGDQINLITVVDCADQRAARLLEERMSKQAREGELTRDDKRIFWSRSLASEKLQEELRRAKP